MRISAYLDTADEADRADHVLDGDSLGRRRVSRYSTPQHTDAGSRETLLIERQLRVGTDGDC